MFSELGFLKLSDMGFSNIEQISERLKLIRLVSIRSFSLKYPTDISSAPSDGEITLMISVETDNLELRDEIFSLLTSNGVIALEVGEYIAKQNDIKKLHAVSAM
ncbi:hypothetical protein GCM10007938_12750 [Vibrio zhanjiangensis]|uniref:Uncharacterized protein n=1 Tax=Vibrio zhanjiangensis TaxID=1046128 RepID=A0ABQ6EWE8_9VIBR|nr:hypothetical protein GCM10007938_12750 [Vibrio zhanjiangensis]